MMKKLFLIGAAVTFVSGSAFAFGGGHSFIEKLDFLVDLSDEQVVAIDQIRQERLPDMEGSGNLRSNLSRIKRENMADFLKLDPESANYHYELEQLAKDKANKLEKFVISRGLILQEVYSVLTEDQKQELKSKKEKLKAKLQAK